MNRQARDSERRISTGRPFVRGADPCRCTSTSGSTLAGSDLALPRGLLIPPPPIGGKSTVIDPGSSSLAAVEESLFGLSSYGFCIHCGSEVIHIEPDATNNPSEPRGRRGGHGAEQLLLVVRDVSGPADDLARQQDHLADEAPELHGDVLPAVRQQQRLGRVRLAPVAVRPIGPYALEPDSCAPSFGQVRRPRWPVAARPVHGPMQ